MSGGLIIQHFYSAYRVRGYRGAVSVLLRHFISHPSFSVRLISTLVDDCDQLRRRHSSSDRHCTAALIIFIHHKLTGDRSFPVAATRTWNSLPPSVTASQSLQTYWKRSKTGLFLPFFRDSLFCNMTLKFYYLCHEWNSITN